MTRTGEVTAVIGAGIAGASTAYFLSRKGVRNIIVFERENLPGARSTARNAAILRTLIGDLEIRGLARQSGEFYRNPPQGFAPEPLLDPVGVYLAARSQFVETLRSWCADGKPEQPDPKQLYDAIPYLSPGLTAAAFDRDEGVLDVNGILQGFLKNASKAGAEVRTDCDVKSLTVDSGRVTGLQTAHGTVKVKNVVIAGGAWARQLPEAAGFGLPLVPYRRHLLVTDPLPQVNPRWPVVWILGEEFYFRPESGGLLLSGCDTARVEPEQGEIVDHAEIEKIAAKTAIWLPSLANAGAARSWAGMRTFAADEQFVIGPDPRLQGLFWAAGFGGHGITCAPAVGALAADWVADGHSSHPGARTFAPDRLLVN